MIAYHIALRCFNVVLFPPATILDQSCHAAPPPTSWRIARQESSCGSTWDLLCVQRFQNVLLMILVDVTHQTSTPDISETLDRGSDGRRSSRNLGLYALVIAFPETMSSSATIFQGAATYMPGKGQATACAGPEYICQRATIQHGQRPFVSTTTCMKRNLRTYWSRNRTMSLTSGTHHVEEAACQLRILPAFVRPVALFISGPTPLKAQ